MSEEYVKDSHVYCSGCNDWLGMCCDPFRRTCDCQKIDCFNPDCKNKFEDGEGVIINNPDEGFCSNECCNDFIDSQKS